jgi:transcriptional regulator with XRE-family HTH domain
MKNGNRLRVRRAELRITQWDTAKRARISSQSRYSLIENGYAQPSEAERRRLARALKSEEAELFPEKVSA